MTVSLAAAAVVAIAVVAFLVRARRVLPTAPPLAPTLSGSAARRLAVLARRVRVFATPPYGRGRPSADEPMRTEEQESLSRMVRLATRNAGHAHHLLRPALAEIARGRLAGQGIDFDAEPARARAALGDDLALLLAADRPLPADFFAPGIPFVEIEAYVARLEAL